MDKNNINGIFFTNNEGEFGKLFNEFNIYIRDLDKEVAEGEALVYQLSDIPSPDSVIQSLDSYDTKGLSDLQGHFRSLNDAFDSLENRIQTALSSIIK